MSNTADEPSAELLPAPQTLEALEEMASAPTEGLVADLSRLEGDILVLGAGGKMGLSLARMAKRALQQAGQTRRVIAVSRFSRPAQAEALRQSGVETVPCELLDEAQVARLPDAPNVIYMAGFKFGATGSPALTWAVNSYLPAIVCKRFPASRMVVFSTGNVYGLTSPVHSRGSRETDPPDPIGEYAMSCLGRERIFEYFSQTLSIPMSVIRLNYASDLRYGVLVDLAQRVRTGQPVQLAMGWFNTIWQADACAVSLQSLAHAAAPAFILNVTGPEILSTRAVAEQFGRWFGEPVQFTGTPGENALLSDTRRAQDLFGPPRVSAQQLMRWTVEWVGQGGALLGKPTHFERRDGRF